MRQRLIVSLRILIFFYFCFKIQGTATFSGSFILNVFVKTHNRSLFYFRYQPITIGIDHPATVGRLPSKSFFFSLFKIILLCLYLFMYYCTLFRMSAIWRGIYVGYFPTFSSIAHILSLTSEVEATDVLSSLRTSALRPGYICPAVR